MNEYLFAYFVPPNECGNVTYASCSKSEAVEEFNKEFKKGIILNIIEL